MQSLKLHSMQYVPETGSKAARVQICSCCVFKGEGGAWPDARLTSVVQACNGPATNDLRFDCTRPGPESLSEGMYQRSFGRP